MKRNTLVSVLSVIAIVLGLGFVLRPLFTPGFFISDDGEWMVIRLSAFYRSLSSGQFPVRFVGRLNNSYGYPVANFLYPGFLYIGSALHFWGVSLINAVKIILGVSVVGGALAVFAALKTRYRPLPSLAGALSFIFAPYLLYDLYTRGSVGEVLAIGAFAVATLAVMKGWPWLLSPSIALLVVSHNTVALIAVVALFMLILAQKDRRNLFLAALVGIGAAAFFWLPAIFEKHIVRFDTVSVSNPFSYFIHIKNAGLLGFSTLIALALMMSLGKKKSVYDKMTIALVIVGIVLSVPVSAPLWRIPIFASLVQFPYRFLVLPTVLGPWIVAYAADRLKGWKLVGLSVVFVTLWIMGAAAEVREVEYITREEGYYTTNEATTNVASEYMPRWVRDIPKSRPVETLEVIDGDAMLSTRTFIGEQIVVDIEAKETSIVQINKIYYPGWGVAIDKTLVPIDYRNSVGVMRVTVPQGKHTMVAAFRETPFRFAADVVSLVSVIGYLVLFRRLRGTL